MQFGKVLVTGGAGFVGSQLVRALLPVSEKIYVLDNLSTGRRSAIPKAEKVVFYHDSITNPNVLDEILPSVEWIFHLSCRNLLLSAVDMNQDFDANLYGGFMLLQKARTHCPGLKRFVYTSTASVYGNAPVIPTPENFYDVTMPYSASKFAVEHYCQVFRHMYGLPTTILRLSNVYGHGQTLSNPYCGVITLFMNAVLSRQPITIYGDGTQTRDFTFIDDALGAMFMAATNPSAVGKVYNVGTGRETSINDLAKSVICVSGNESHPVIYQPKRIIDKVQRRALDCQALTSDLGWQPGYSLEEGIKKTFDWIQESV